MIRYAKILVIILAAFFAADCFANNNAEIVSLLGENKASVEEFAKRNQLISIDVLGENTIALHKTEKMDVCGINPMVVLLNFEAGVCKSIQITTNHLPENAVKELESKVKAKITVQHVVSFGIYNIFLIIS